MACAGLRTYLMLCGPLLSSAFLSSTRSTTALWSVRMTGQCCRHHSFTDPDQNRLQLVHDVAQTIVPVRRRASVARTKRQ